MMAADLRKGWTLVLASLVAFISALDVVVVSTALPTLRTRFGASLSDLALAPSKRQSSPEDGPGPGPAAAEPAVEGLR